MHRTNEQDVVAAKERLAHLKTAYLKVVGEYIFHDTQDKEESLRAILNCQQTGASYFNFAEEFVGNSDLLGAHVCALWAQGFAEDCAEILKSMPAHFQLLTAGLSQLSAEAYDEALPGSTAFANMQRMVVKYLKSDESKRIQSLFEQSGLPIYGFKNEAREFMSKKIQTILSYVFGVVFVIVLLVIAFVQPEPSSFQYAIFKTVLALAGAALVVVIPGFIEVTIGNWLRAGGALAVFVLLYFWNPARLTSEPVTSSEPNTSVLGTMRDENPKRH